VTDDIIEEIYVMCVEAAHNGQKRIPVHIFPMRMVDEPPEVPSEPADQMLETFRLKLIKALIGAMEQVNKVFRVSVFSDSLNYLKNKITPEIVPHTPRAVSQLPPFWENLKQGHDFFEQNRRLPDINVAEDGVYQFVFSGEDLR
jgi:murein L,D-transpeptidase YafK